MPASRGQAKRKSKPQARKPAPLVVIALVSLAAVGIFVIALVAGVFGGSDEDAGYSGVAHPFAIEAHYLGSPDAKVTVVVWQDFLCADCQAIAQGTLQQIKASFVDTGKARLQYRHFPSGGAGTASFQAAEATECAAERGGYWDYSNKLLARTNDGQPNKATLEALAAELRFNKSLFSECLASQRYAFSIEKERTQATTLGLTAAPAVFVNGVLQASPVSYESLAASIESALSGASR
ncbi:MAG: DsbA family protein [Dehalococcoidia bacterium]